MRAKLIYEDIKDILKPKSEEEILASLPGRSDLIFKPTDKSADWTAYMGSFSASYKNLVKLFGKPNAITDEYKVSTEWVLEDNEGNIVTIYDWKMTDLYDEGLYSVEEFRKLDSYDWHIGGHKESDADNLISFIYLNFIRKK